MFVTLTNENKRSIFMSVILTFTLILSMAGATLPAQAAEPPRFPAASQDTQQAWETQRDSFNQVTYLDLVRYSAPYVRVSDNAPALAELKAEGNPSPTAEQVKERVYKHYGDYLNLERAFEANKAELDVLMPKLIEVSQRQNGTGSISEQQIKPFLLGLAYLRHYYGFQMADVPFFEIMLADLNAYNAVERIVSVGQYGYTGLSGRFTVKAYTDKLALDTAIDNLPKYLKAKLNEYEPGVDPDAWLKQQSKAIIVDQSPVTLFEKYERYPETTYQLLPLLAVKTPSVYVGNVEHSIQYGLTSTYEVGEDELRNLISSTLTEQTAFWDFWKRISTTADVLQNHKHTVVWDTVRRGQAYGNTASQQWSPRRGADVDPGVRDFFTPLSQWEPYRSLMDAYAADPDVKFLAKKALGQPGVNTYSHELTHVYEDKIWFNGEGVRSQVGPEIYARGLFETENNTPGGHTQFAPFFNLNLAYELGEDRIQNKSPERFQTPADIQQYMQGVMDVLYSLDAMEANSSLKLSDDLKVHAFNRVTELPEPNASYADVTRDSFEHITQGEAAALQNINDIIDAGLVSGRFVPKGVSPTQTVPRNEYVTVPLFEPIYAGLQNDSGTVGSVLFRRYAHELLAEYGWDQGFIGYLSDRYPTDGAALQAIAAAHGGTMNSFKKAMFERRINKFDQMKPAAGYANAQEMQAAMDAAVAADIQMLAQNKQNMGTGPASNVTVGVTAVRDLKQRIFQAYLLSTNDFRSSIYQEPQPTEERETRTEEIPVEEEIILDDTILAGTPDEVVNPGQAGERELTYVYTLVNGQRQGEGRLENTRVTREMVKRQIRRGTKAMPLTPANVNAVDYTLPADKVKITVTDNGAEKPVAEAGDVKFRFTVKETPTGGSVTGVPEAPVAPQANGELPAMDPWKFTGAGTYVIEVTQVPGAVEGMTYDTTPRTLTVVTDWETVPGSTARRLVVKSVTFAKDGQTVTAVLFSNTVRQPDAEPPVKHIAQADVPRPEAPCDPRLATRTWKVPADSESMKWAVNSEGELVVTAAEGHIFDMTDGTTSQTINFGLPSGTESCSIEIPVPPNPPHNGQHGSGTTIDLPTFIWQTGDGVTIDLPTFPLGTGGTGTSTPQRPGVASPLGKPQVGTTQPADKDAVQAAPAGKGAQAKTSKSGSLAGTGAASGVLTAAGLFLAIGLVLRRRH